MILSWFADKVFHARKRKKDCLMPVDWSVGTNRYAHEHWVHTHPHVHPCDVFPDVNWLYGYRKLNVDLQLVLFDKAPRNFTFSKKVEFVNPPEPHIQLNYRLHELRQLYNATPANDSFVWTWYQQHNLS